MTEQELRELLSRPVEVPREVEARMAETCARAGQTSGKRRPRRGLRTLVLAACLGLLLLSALNSNTTFHLVAAVTGYHNSEYIGFLLLYLIVCYIGMLAAVALATVVAWVLRKINY